MNFLEILIGVCLLTHHSLGLAVPTKTNKKLGISPEELGGQLEGDMEMPEIAASGVIDHYRKWPDARIPYVIQNSFNSQERRIILEAMSEIYKKTCFSFRERNGEDGYVKIIKGRRGSGCWATVGYTGIEQNVHLGTDCIEHGIVAHELIHAIGFFHEQSRSDRHKFVRIIDNNILPGQLHNFKQLESTEVTHFNLPYDYKSIMHYGYNYFAINRRLPTMTPTDPRISYDSLGQRNNLSEIDVQKIKLMYSLQQDCSATGAGENSNSNCAGKFQCANDKCVEKHYRCDNENDCGDNSDEANCSGFTFTCTNGNIIPVAKRCDCSDDCGDNSDEKYCVRVPPSSGKFRCKNKKCVHKSHTCDNENDCGDNSDEANCATVQFTCTNNVTIPSSKRCDCQDDCGDNSDEKNCLGTPSGGDKFRCKNFKCVQKKFKCDNENDCGDNSDEADCAGVEFNCANGEKVPSSKRCNCANDCGDESDEKDCIGTPNARIFRCKDKRCITTLWTCDGDPDCDDNSDELHKDCQEGGQGQGNKIKQWKVQGYEDEGHLGHWFTIHGSPGSCENVPQSLDNKASSINTKGTCVRLYDGSNCTGSFIEAQPGSKCHSSMKDCDFNDKISSAGSCYILGG